MGFHFRLGVSTVGQIVKETIQIIWIKLQPTEMPITDEDEWERIAEDFFERRNFPMCVGAIDGKHVQLKAPFHSGSRYFNYKGFHSIVLLAIADAKARFIVVDVGAYGSSSDGGILQDSMLHRLMTTNKLKLPQPKRLQETENELPYVFVGDEAFPLLTHLMRPFPRRDLTDDKRIFNYRLSRARLQVERAFGLISSMWRILRKPIEVQPDFAIDIVKTIYCVLHNYVQNKEPERLRDLDTNDTCTLRHVDAEARNHGKYTQDAANVRTTLMRYFLSPSGTLHWQNDILY